MNTNQNFAAKYILKIITWDAGIKIQQKSIRLLFLPYLKIEAMIVKAKIDFDKKAREKVYRGKKIHFE